MNTGCHVKQALPKCLSLPFPQNTEYPDCADPGVASLSYALPQKADIIVTGVVELVGAGSATCVPANGTDAVPVTLDGMMSNASLPQPGDVLPDYSNPLSDTIVVLIQVWSLGHDQMHVQAACDAEFKDFNRCKD